MSHSEVFNHLFNHTESRLRRGSCEDYFFQYLPAAGIEKSSLRMFKLPAAGVE